MENLKIYIDRLKDGHKQKMEEKLSPEFLEIEEEDLVFNDPILLHGEVYIANDHLVLHLDIETFAYLPCSICNDAVQAQVQIKNLYLTHPLSEIQGAVFNLKDEIRESILLQTPLFVECHQGRCPEREYLKKFLKSEANLLQEKEDVHFPFADLYEK